MFCPLGTESLAIQHEPHVTLVVLEHHALCHILALRFHEVLSFEYRPHELIHCNCLVVCSAFSINSPFMDLVITVSALSDIISLD